METWILKIQGAHPFPGGRVYHVDLYGPEPGEIPTYGSCMGAYLLEMVCDFTSIVPPGDKVEIIVCHS